MPTEETPATWHKAHADASARFRETDDESHATMPAAHASDACGALAQDASGHRGPCIRVRGHGGHCEPAPVAAGVLAQDALEARVAKLEAATAGMIREVERRLKSNTLSRDRLEGLAPVPGIVDRIRVTLCGEAVYLDDVLDLVRSARTLLHREVYSARNYLDAEHRRDVDAVQAALRPFERVP